MALQFSDGVRNARLDAIEAAIGTSAILKLRSGPPPATPATGDSGTVLCQINLPSDYLNNAANGVKGKAGTWSGTASGGGGTIGHFRIYKSDGTTCCIQGTVGTSGDMAIDNPVVSDGQTITVTSFALTDANQ